MTEISCRDVVELVTEYLEGALPASDRVTFEQHLADCPGCAEYLAQMRETIRLTGESPDGDIPPDVLDELVAAFREIRDRRGA